MKFLTVNFIFLLLVAGTAATEREPNFSEICTTIFQAIFQPSTVGFLKTVFYHVCEFSSPSPGINCTIVKESNNLDLFLDYVRNNLCTLSVPPKVIH